jgi:hypothetical protein
VVTLLDFGFVFVFRFSWNYTKLPFDHEFGEYSLRKFVGSEQVKIFLSHEQLLDLVASIHKFCLGFEFLHINYFGIQLIGLKGNGNFPHKFIVWSYNGTCLNKL